MGKVYDQQKTVVVVVSPPPLEKLEKKSRNLFYVLCFT